MRHGYERGVLRAGAVAALAAVVGLATPAVAVEDSSTTVQVSPASPTVGQSVVLTATVSCPGDPSGGVGMTFFDGDVLLDTVGVGANGVAAYTTTFTTTGTHLITAAYNGNDNCFASNNDTVVTVAQTPPPPDQPCLLVLCGTLTNLVDFTVGDIHNEIN